MLYYLTRFFTIAETQILLLKELASASPLAKEALVIDLIQWRKMQPPGAEC